jgi:hypothetical protein
MASVNSILEKADMIKWIKSKVQEHHYSWCNMEDLDSRGYCNCGRDIDKDMSEKILNLITK